VVKARVRGEVGVVVINPVPDQTVIVFAPIPSAGIENRMLLVNAVLTVAALNAGQK
jgi:hypothetical protein